MVLGGCAAYGPGGRCCIHIHNTYIHTCMQHFEAGAFPSPFPSAIPFRKSSGELFSKKILLVRRELDKCIFQVILSQKEFLRKLPTFLKKRQSSFWSGPANYYDSPSPLAPCRFLQARAQSRISQSVWKRCACPSPFPFEDSLGENSLRQKTQIWQSTKHGRKWRPFCEEIGEQKNHKKICKNELCCTPAGLSARHRYPTWWFSSNIPTKFL